MLRRHLTREQKRDVVAALLKANPANSDRAIAKLAHLDHKTVATVRAKAETRGEIPHVVTRIDTQGRQQPAAKPTPAISHAAPPPVTLLSSADRSKVRQAMPTTLIQVSTLLRLDPARTIEELVRCLKDARRNIVTMPIEKRVAAGRGVLAALGVNVTDLRPAG